MISQIARALMSSCVRALTRRVIAKACAPMWVDRSTLQYESRLIKRDTLVVAGMHEPPAQYPTAIAASRCFWIDEAIR